MASNDMQVVRVVFQILTEGDRLKMDAVSNVSQTGGGARDLRFRPETAFLPIFRKMLPEVVKTRRIQRVRGALERQSTQIETYKGTVFWMASGQERSRKMTVWPATGARPNECRIGGINRFDFSGLVKQDPARGGSIFMLYQLQNGVVRVDFTTETSLKVDAWHSTIKAFAKDWMETDHRAAFLDLETKERFPS